MELNKITHGILDEIRKFTVTISGNRKFLNSVKLDTNVTTDLEFIFNRYPTPHVFDIARYQKKRKKKNRRCSIKVR